MAMVLDTKIESGFPYWASVRRRFGPDSPFFASGNIDRELPAKHAALDFTEDEKYQLDNIVTEDGSMNAWLKFKNYKSQQQHLLDKHKFPTSFEFFKKAHPSKRQKHHRKRALHKKEASTTMEVEDETIGGLASAVSKLSTSDSTPSVNRCTSGLTFIPRAAMRERRSDSTSAGTK